MIIGNTKANQRMSGDRGRDGALGLTQHDRSAVTQDNDRRNQAPDPRNQLEELGHEALIN
jgi:hypothetical protein